MQLLAFKKSRSSCKKSWSPQEDHILTEMVKQYGTSSWTKIAEGLNSRTGKQCRERYHNHLQPDIRKGEWTEEEDRIIVEMQIKLGNQWAKITKMLPGRTDNAVKNRWHAAMRTQGRVASGYGGSSKASARKNRQPRVPTLPLGKAGVSSASSSRLILEDEDYHNLFGNPETDGESLSSTEPHHVMHDHTDSARTESVHNSARSTSDGASTEGHGNEIEYSTFSPRLSEFLCFPISSSSSSARELPAAADEAVCPADLLAADASPREVQSWLSASPRDKEATFVFGAYINSPGKEAPKVKSECKTSSGMSEWTAISDRNLQRVTFSPPKITAADMRRKRFNFDGAAAEDGQLFAHLRANAPTVVTSDAGRRMSNTGDLSELSGASTMSTNSEADDVDVTRATSDGSYATNVSNMTDADFSSDGSDDDNSDFAFPEFDKIEISPRWQMCPRESPYDMEFKRQRSNGTPLHMRTNSSFFMAIPSGQEENCFAQQDDGEFYFKASAMDECVI